MKAWEIYSIHCTYYFYYETRDEFSIYYIKKVLYNKMIENCTITLNKSKLKFKKHLARFCRLCRYKHMSLSYLSSIEYDSNESCVCAKNRLVFCPECTNSNSNDLFKCTQCIYYKLLLRQCTNECSIDSMYIMPYIKDTKKGILLYNIGSYQYPENDIILRFSNIASINCMIKNLQFIKSKMSK